MVVLIGRFAPGRADRTARPRVHHGRATLIFAITVRPLGLVISSYVALVIASIRDRGRIRWLEAVIWAAVLTAVLLDPVPLRGLNLPLQLWPRF